jgi:hypothetical protein
MKNQLNNFLQKAKKKTFASRISIPKIQGEKKVYVYKEKDFKYQDKYFGSIVDTGQELVFHKGKLLWSMSYRGGMIEGYENLSKKCFSFLKECLRNAPKNFPVRGQKIYKKGFFKYENHWKGDIEDFVGEEKIFWKNNQIYFRNYLGGMGKSKKLEGI